jgi:5'(3')-deoxyribonucleotidase
MRIYIDMDGVIVDFENYRLKMQKAVGYEVTGDMVKRLHGAYRDMKPMAGALPSVRLLISHGHDVWIATKPPTGISWAYADKAEWIFEHLPELKRKLIITHDKSLLIGDVLIDDRPHKANADKFQGRLLHFSETFGWEEVLDALL